MQKILVLVFGIAFGLVALAMVFQAAKTPGDIRSRAKEVQSIYKQWEFNGATTEGWSSSSVSNGYLKFLIAAPGTPSTENKTVSASMPMGLKTIIISMKVSSRGSIPIPYCPPGKQCDFDQGPSPAIEDQFTAQLTYTLSGKGGYAPPFVFSGIADGIMKTYSFTIPSSEAITVQNMQISFINNSKPGNLVAIDWIRLMGPVQSSVYPTSTRPTPGIYFSPRQ